MTTLHFSRIPLPLHKRTRRSITQQRKESMAVQRGNQGAYSFYNGLNFGACVTLFTSVFAPPGEMSLNFVSSQSLPLFQRCHRDSPSL